MIAFPPFTGIVRAFVIACAAVYALLLLGTAIELGQGASLSNWITLNLGLNPEGLFSGKIWQPLTWIFIHSVNDPFHIIFNLLAFWMFGSMVEYQFGPRRFIYFCFFSALFCAAVVVGLGFFHASTWMSVTVGASGIVFAILVAVARLFPNQMVIFIIFPIKMKYLAMLLVGMNIFFSFMGSGKDISYAAHLGGAFFGYAYISWMNSQGGGGGRPGDDWLRNMRDQWTKKRKRRHLRVVYPGGQEQRSDDDPTFHAVRLSV